MWEEPRSNESKESNQAGRNDCSAISFELSVRRRKVLKFDQEKQTPKNVAYKYEAP